MTNRGTLSRFISSSIVVCFLVACAPNNVDGDHEVNAMVVQSTNYHLKGEHDIAILQSPNGTSAKKLQANIVVMREPKSESIVAGSKPDVLVKLKKVTNNHYLVQAKSPIPAGRYGIYFGGDKEKSITLLHSFFSAARPRLVANNFLKSHVDKNRIWFSFDFDQPVLIHEDTVSLVTRDIDASLPLINKVLVSFDRKTLFVRLGPEILFSENKRYAFLFKASLTDDALVPIDIAPQEFIVGESISPETVNEPKLSWSDNSATVTWLDKEPHDVKLLFHDHDQNILLLSAHSPSVSSGIMRLHATHLLPKTNYRVLVRHENSRGEIAIIRREFVTNANMPLYISEIMNNPDGDDRGDGEYIEIANVSSDDISLEGIYLSIEDVASGITHDCPLSSKEAAAIVEKNSHAIITSAEFTSAAYSAIDPAAVIKLPQKTLCHGLANNKPKIITLHYNDGSFIDRYGGFLWHTKKGQSIQRKDKKGLDVANNYCYSNIRYGPTPGRLNGPCGMHDREVNNGRT